MKGKLALALLVVTGASWASVVVGTPDIPSMDPFCAS